MASDRSGHAHKVPGISQPRPGDSCPCAQWRRPNRRKYLALVCWGRAHWKQSFRPSPTMPSSPTVRTPAWWRPPGRSSGCACPDRTTRASSA